MVKDLLPSFRSFRSSLITGVIILIMIYLLAYDIHDDWQIPNSIKNIFSLNKYMEITLIALIAVLVGSLYTTALEGIVDWLHRKQVNSPPSRQTPCKLLARIYLAFTPFSSASYSRIVAEIKRFYLLHREHAGYCSNSLSVVVENDFIKKNLVEILWMEGKFVGTPLKDEYDQYRSEGESRLAIALLLPGVLFAVCHVFDFNTIFTVILLIVIILVSLLLADYGLYYYRRANSFLAHHIADGKIMTSTMEDLSRNCSERNHT